MSPGIAGNLFLLGSCLRRNDEIAVFVIPAGLGRYKALYPASAGMLLCLGPGLRRDDDVEAE